ncbi:PLP-dependent aminotransferase family protein [Burkholderia glumae]|uniref:aminotransferase-like domain-containing protein n=1 Tax=Burkholderia glumae TaxID=337 RepID=UPI000F5E2FE1|nr:PLP-dependent aminotransferase family protein [Burkholderia glumae]MCM2494963.1 PLP-dependent aminotransferase family protein [Burkholderia glumae]MCM2545828.1 PLP-dependent aminotransferase family protein [Burkholderia glumae]MCM2551639.1 PLP-dependent aminotransferase family protein [Burkholderia glumae]NVE25410.1 PLP-dependent aminotransferase family protein [Burkholderia glumae]QGA39477.1 aminotransferase class I/II-fold pyridoxal phosphate-dependent enzyme [Burkholderia glumae]
MSKPLDLALDRSAALPLAEQIGLGIAAAIDRGVLAPGARLPSWLDLAAQLGVARGTVKAAYERLVDAQLVVASRPGGTRVAERPPRLAGPDAVPGAAPLPGPFWDFFPRAPTVFQNGVPASDCFPAALFARLRSRAARAEATAPAVYPDPRGEPALRRAIAAHLAIARGIECRPSQVFVTAGFSGARQFALSVLRAEGRRAWLEEPGFVPSRRALSLARIEPVPVPVDEDGIDVDYGLRHAPDAAFALLTPGQQAPLGPTLSLARRRRLLEWAGDTGASIIEDDYLGELQLRRRAAPALASLDTAGRVIHIGSFSKTISPALRLGFLVAPAPLAARFGEAAACFAPAPDVAVQLAAEAFMREGHYMRHLRRMKRVYAARGHALQTRLEALGYQVHPAGLAMLLRLPDGTRASDVEIALAAGREGLAPGPLSPWFAAAGGGASAGLLLGVATAGEARLADACARLDRVIRAHA